MQTNFINVPLRYHLLIKKVVKDFLEKYRINPQASVNVQFVSSQKIRDLNKKYRQRDESTDVLSFPIWPNPEEMPKRGEIDLGDIIICPQETSLAGRLEKLVRHSLRHLIGKHH